jgi:hypothetical protein
LTARSYELEYDLLASALHNHLKIVYVGPLAMQPRGSSEFGSDAADVRAVANSVQKLRFIMHKLALTDDDIIELLQRYIEGGARGSEYALPATYVNTVTREFASTADRLS